MACRLRITCLRSLLLLLMTYVAIRARIANGLVTYHDTVPSRRSVMVALPGLASMWLLGPRLDSSDSVARALTGPLERKEHRQLELCLVNLLRLQYWAVSLSEKMATLEGEEERKKAYLEARLGSKVLVAESKKIGGGANANVFMLRSLQLKDCLDDLKFYSGKIGSRKQMDQYQTDLIEALASIVEFDGLETTQDPSPRSALTLQMYTDQKGVYVQRMLAERVTPLTDEILRLFGPDAKSQSEYNVREFYPKELPAVLQTPPAQNLASTNGST